MGNAGYAAVWALVLIIPLENAMIIPGVGTLGRITGIFALLIGIIALVVQRKGIRLHSVLWFMLIFVLLSGVSFFWTIDQQSTLQRTFTYFQNLLMMWLIFQWCDDEKKIQGLYLAFVLGSLGLTYGMLDQFQNGEMAVRIDTYNFNPNEIASILSFSIPFSWFLFLVKKGPIRWAFIPVIPAVFLAILLTGSRAGLIKGLIGFVFILMTPPPRAGRAWGVISFAAILVTIGSVVQFLPEHTLERLLTTQEELSSGSLGGREYIWSLGFEVFTQHPVLGVGAGAFKDTMTPFFATSPAPHNVLVAIMVDQGLLGLLTFGMVALPAVLSIFRQSGIERRLWIALLGIWGGCILTSNWEWRKQMWLLLIFAVIHGVVRVRQKTMDYENLNEMRTVEFSAPLQIGIKT